ncbi:MipA/OmpV family protein [Pendulispora rubella]|uniref:MipA/OmpV family protein n=1 Tax=Pendulispora rubella TaxID=2741070 RepID=A0ABZ2L8T0_9BACT
MMNRWIFGIFAFLVTFADASLASERSACADEPAPDVVSEPAPPRPAAARVAVGAGALTMPEYPGAAHTRILPLPFIDAHVGPLYLSTLKGIGLELGEGILYGGTSVYVDIGRNESSDPARLAGRGDIGLAADPRVYLGLRHALGTMALAHVETSLHRHLGGSDAFLADASAGVSLSLGRRQWTLDGSASTTWMDARYARTFFDVQGSGLRDVTISVFASYAINERWSVGALARVGVLVGDAGSSPVVATRLQPSTVTFLRYDFR